MWELADLFLWDSLVESFPPQPVSLAVLEDVPRIFSSLPTKGAGVPLVNGKLRP